MTHTEGEGVGRGNLRIMRTWPTDGPDSPWLDPDIGDYLRTQAGTLYVVVGARPTRGHPPTARRITMTVQRIDALPAGVHPFELHTDHQAPR